MTSRYHIGKLSKEVSTVVTEEFFELMQETARAHGCKPSDLMREGLYKLLTGETYSGHVAKDMATALDFPQRKQAENSGAVILPNPANSQVI